jgi:hypothetical protein
MDSNTGRDEPFEPVSDRRFRGLSCGHRLPS